MTRYFIHNPVIVQIEEALMPETALPRSGRRRLIGSATLIGAEVEPQIRQAGGEATYIKADVLVEDEVKAFIDRTVATYRRLDVAFNNAGITIEKPLHEYTAA